jgi:hypothetical protein
MAGVALIGLGSMSALWVFYAFYLINALGYVCGGSRRRIKFCCRSGLIARG